MESLQKLLTAAQVVQAHFEALVDQPQPENLAISLLDFNAINESLYDKCFAHNISYKTRNRDLILDIMRRANGIHLLVLSLIKCPGCEALAVDLWATYCSLMHLKDEDAELMSDTAHVHVNDWCSPSVHHLNEPIQQRENCRTNYWDSKVHIAITSLIETPGICRNPYKSLRGVAPRNNNIQSTHPNPGSYQTLRDDCSQSNVSTGDVAAPLSWLQSPSVLFSGVSSESAALTSSEEDVHPIGDPSDDVTNENDNESRMTVQGNVSYSNVYVNKRLERRCNKIFSELCRRIHNGNYCDYLNARYLLRQKTTEPNMKFVLAYADVNYHLFNNNKSEAEETIEEALHLCKFTSRPNRFTLHILSKKSWLYSQENLHGLMGVALEQASEVAELDQAECGGTPLGWFYVNKAHAIMAMISMRNESRLRRMINMAVHCLEKAIHELNGQSDIGVMTCKIEIAKCLLACGDRLQTVDYLPPDADRLRARRMIQEVEDSPHEAANTLQIHVDLALCDYFIRMGTVYKDKAYNRAKEAGLVADMLRMEEQQLQVDARLRYLRSVNCIGDNKVLHCRNEQPEKTGFNGPMLVKTRMDNDSECNDTGRNAERKEKRKKRTLPSEGTNETHIATNPSTKTKETQSNDRSTKMSEDRSAENSLGQSPSFSKSQTGPICPRMTCAQCYTACTVPVQCDRCMCVFCLECIGVSMEQYRIIQQLPNCLILCSRCLDVGKRAIREDINNRIEMLEHRLRRVDSGDMQGSF